MAKLKTMKKFLLALPLSIFFVLSLFGQQIPHGIVLESLSMRSEIMKKDVKYSVYLPADYFTDQRKYPVVYLLHGYTGKETDWVQFGEANRTADKMMANSEIPDMIIVMPDGANDWYMNSYDGKTNYEDFFIKELIPYIDSAYQTRPERGYRAISGLSMGGEGSTLLAIKYPNVFAACAGLSSAFRTDEEMVTLADDRYENTFGQLYGRDLKGESRLTEAWKKNSALSLLETLPLENIKKVRYYFDCGDDDYLYKGNSAMHVLMSDKKISHEFRMRDGAHNWTYWRTGLGDALKFIGESFKH